MSWWALRSPLQGYRGASVLTFTNADDGTTKSGPNGCFLQSINDAITKTIQPTGHGLARNNPYPAPGSFKET